VGYRLNVAALGLGDERLNEIAPIIAEETEVQRERKRAQFSGQGCLLATRVEHMPVRALASSFGT
jgi:hypothetical protein